MKKRNTFSRVLVAQWCIVMLGVILLLSACGGSSSPNAQPNSTPSNGGYSLVQLVSQEFHAFLTPAGR